MSDKITLTHGGGGRIARKLIEETIVPALGTGSVPAELGDGAVLRTFSGTPVMTTDAFVVQPREFPGGNIGTLCVSGTVNDLLASGARPKFLSLALILEDGLPIEELQKCLKSIKEAADEAGVSVVCGDTKVVEHGAADGIFITTAGIGELAIDPAPAPSRLEGKTDVAVILSGTLGDHGLTIMACREELTLESPVKSDCAPLTDMLMPVMEELGSDILCMRDPTRGGLAAVLGEIAEQANIGIDVIQKNVPIDPVVQGACNLLGLDPFAIANEGKMVLFVESASAEKALAILRKHKYGKNAAIIGKTTSKGARPVNLVTPLGVKRPLEIPLGDTLPRIC